MRRDMLDYWGSAIRRSWMVIPVLIVWAVTAGFNAKMGYEVGGGPDEFPMSLLYGIMFIGLAALGAYGFANADKEAGARKLALITVGCLQLAVGLQAGFQSLCLTLSKGAAGLENKAADRSTRVRQLKAAEAEFEKLPVPRSIAAIEADEKLECAIRGRQYKDGVGPRCTQLRSELANAQRYQELKPEIDRLTKELQTAPRVRDAGAQFEVASTFGSMVKSWWGGRPHMVTPDDVRFWWLVFLVCVLEIVGVLGFWLVGLHGEPSRARSDDDDGAGGRAAGDFFGDVLGADMAIAGMRNGPTSSLWQAPPEGRARPIQIGVDRQLAPPPKRAALTGGQEVLPPPPGGDASGAAAGGAGTATAHGSYFTFNIGARDGVTDVTPQVAPRRGEAPAMPPRPDLGAIPDAPPPDRTTINAINDNLLAFRAACVVPVTGGHVTACDMYRRYVAWRGPGALGPEAFRALFPAVAGLDRIEVAGQVHYHGVTLRAPALQAVAG